MAQLASKEYLAPTEPVVAEQPAEAPPPAPPRRLATIGWVSTTYFTEGLPYMIVRWLAQVYATDIGLPEKAIGALNFLGIPWNFKFLWAPLVDWVGTRRGWLIKVQIAVTILLALLAGLVGLGPPGHPASAHTGASERVTWAQLAAAHDPHTGLSHLSIVVLVLATLIVLSVAAATNDICIDGFYIEGLPDRRDQAAYSGLRVLAYRVAVLFARLALIGFSVWMFGFGVAALVMGVLTLFHIVVLPRFHTDIDAGPRRAEYLPHLLSALRTFLDQPRIAVVLGFLATYKIGDALLIGLNSTFLLREIHMSRHQLAWLSGYVGTGGAIVGTMVGAWWIRRVGLRRSIWPLTLAMNVTIWAYVWLAWARPDPATARGLWEIGTIHGYEMLAGGLGDAAFTVFLLYTCKPQFKAAHYAIGSAIMSVAGNVLSGASGYIVEHIGYVGLYVLSFGCSVPSMILLFFLPIERGAGEVAR